ncbi:hypothetical protein BDAP_000151 [Binucleata daphniae]
MSKENVNDLYPLSALFIHACGKKIEPELMESLFKTYKNVEYLPKLGKLFCMSGDKLEEYLGFAGAVPVAAVEVKADAVKEEVKAQEPAKQQAVDMDFDSLFD